MMQPVRPILVADRFGDLHDRLMTLVRALDDADWRRPIPGSDWTVHDVATHLLDTDLRRLAMQRDGHMPPPPPQPIDSPEALLDFLNSLNRRWIEATAGLSPPILVDLLQLIGAQMADFVATLDPHAPALFSVGWAGEETSESWFDIARELTEKWVHQQQIRDAVGAPIVDDPEILHPVIDTFVRGVPFACRDVDAAEGTVVSLEVDGEAGGVWSVVRAAAWELFEGAGEEAPAARVRLSQDTAWRFFSTRRRKPELLPSITIEGDPSLCAGILATTSVMA